MVMEMASAIRTVVADFGECVLDQRMHPPRLTEGWHRAITIPHVRWTNEQIESLDSDIDHRQRVAPMTFLPASQMSR